MGGPMPFLERLAPSTRERCSVRAALAPRFAPGTMTAEVASAEGPTHRASPASDDGDASPARLRMDGVRDITPAPPDARPHGPAQPRITPTTPPSRGTEHYAAESAPHDAPHRASPAEVPAARIEHGQRVVHEAPPITPPRQVQSPQVAPRPRRIAASPTAATQAPLRLSTIEQRMPPAQPQAPMVVQVTIDRIDVRAPPAATAARPTAKPRGQASAQPLADYLCQRDRARNGGAA